MNQKERIEQLFETGILPRKEMRALIEERDEESSEELFAKARIRKEENFGKDIYLRGLIEFSSYCRNDCYYCGIRRSNKNAERYRLTPDEIMECCDEGYKLGFRTFVMQGGEDAYYTDDVLCPIIGKIKGRYPDCAVTLSIGERSYESYERLKNAGADRYLLRHEAAADELYSKLHPDFMSLENRKRCLSDLKRLGYQVGAGFMVGAPYQTVEDIICDLRYMQELQPQMIGIGPFVPHRDTQFRDEKSGTAELTIRLLGIIRLMFPRVLLPATTALGTIAENGRERGLKTGCNVIMPNLSPAAVRRKYSLYDNKIYSGSEAAECCGEMRELIARAGYEVSTERGDFVNTKEN
jgi:biotin synthase